MVKDTSHPGVFRGTVRADGLLIDVETIGLAEARRRVMELLTPTIVVRELGSKHWLVVLDPPVTVRTTSAPGSPLRRIDHQLTNATGIPTDLSGDTALFMAGRSLGLQLSELGAIEPADWIDLDDISIESFVPIEIDGPAAEQISAPPAPAAPDLRRTAQLASRSGRAVALDAAIAALQAAQARHDAGHQRAAAVQNGSPRPTLGQSLSSQLSKLILGTPAAQILGRRHRKYLEVLQRKLAEGDWDEALANAISVAQAESLGISLSLPRGRFNLAPSTQRAVPARSVPWGPDIRAVLVARYQEAAQRLEREGRIEEAAFVYVDLLGQPLDAVAVLERHERLLLAAQIAEGHGLAANFAFGSGGKRGSVQRRFALLAATTHSRRRSASYTKQTRTRHANFAGNGLRCCNVQARTETPWRSPGPTRRYVRPYSTPSARESILAAPTQPCCAPTALLLTLQHQTPTMNYVACTSQARRPTATRSSSRSRSLQRESPIQESTENLARKRCAHSFASRTGPRRSIATHSICSASGATRYCEPTCQVPNGDASRPSKSPSQPSPSIASDSFPCLTQQLCRTATS